MVDLNPLHYINEANHAMGDTLASGLEFLGITDPAVDPDGIREIAKKWRALAKALEEASGDAEKALRDVEWEGKAAKAFHKRAKKVRTQADNTAHALREGAKALDKFADEAHELLSEIGVILVEIIEFEIAGLALSVLTAGLSTVATSLAAGERALRIAALVTRIEQAGTRMGTVVRTVLETIRGLERALKALKEIKTIAAVGKMAKEGAKFSAFAAALEDPGAFKDPKKLATLLTEGAILGVGFGVLAKGLGKGLKALKPSELAKLSKTLKLDGSGLSRLKLRPSEAEELPASIRAALKKCDLDPIDVATGDMLLPQTDVQLPGTLELVLQRTHLSSYRWGGWFGPSWASTLDQRLQADDEGIIYAAPDGARLVYSHPAPDAEEPIYPETGPRIPLTWDSTADGALRITDPDTGLSYVFHSPLATDEGDSVDLPLQAIVNRNGQRITIHYADDGTPTEVTHAGGYRIAIDRHPDLPRIAALRLLDRERPAGDSTTLVSYGYDEDGHLIEVTNSSGLPMRFTYDEAGRITSWSDRNGTTYAYTYDERGRVVHTEGSDGFLSGTLVYDDTNRTTTVTDSLGHVRRYEHNEAFRLICSTDPLGQVTLQEWDDENRLTAVTDALGHTTRYTYTPSGRVAVVLRPDGRRTVAEYNGLDLPTAVTGPDGALWHLEYDERGNRTAVTDPTGATTRVTYSRAGHHTSTVDALGNTTLIRCDAAGLPLKVTDPLGAVTTFERDSFGRPTVITDPSGATTRLEWTTEGKLALSVAPDGATESWSYDGEGNCTSHTDATGAVSRFEYTHFDLIAARTGSDGVRHEFTHDTELRLTKVTNPQGLSWDYVYDPAGRLISESDFDNRTLTYAHDPAGRIETRTDALGKISRFEHDPLGQIIRKDADGAVITYTYDPSGQLVQAVGPDATLTLERDAVGRVLSETVNGRTIHYGYDALGRRTHRTTPTGTTSQWDYDAAGHRVGLVTAGHTLRFAYDPAGRELTRHLDGTMSLTNTYDGTGRLTSQSVVDGAGRIVQSHAYTYRPDGNLIRHDDRLNGTRTFDLDAAGRVTAVHARDWTERYAYDEAGNQTEAAWPTAHPGQEATGTRAYAGTRITRAGNVRYEHDAQGRVVLRQKRRLSRKPDTWRYTWDAEDRLVSVVTPDGSRWRYLYDPLGRRTAKQRLAADGESVVEQVDFTWDGTTLCEQSTVSATQPDPIVLTWDHQGLQPVAQAERITAADAPQEEIDARFFAIVTDLVGTPVELIDDNGDVAWRTRSTLWGSTAWDSESAAYTPLRFPGQYFDPESGLHYNYFRHYDPETARYVSSDPLGLMPAPNPNTYVDNPHAATDPLGLAPDACAYRVEQVPDGEITSLFHYTNEKGYKGILESGALRPSLKEHNPKDARFGDGQYLSDIKPGTKTPGQLSFAFLRVPWAGQKFSHYIEVDVRGLQVMRSVERPDVFVVPNQGPLDLAGRIVNHGKS
ncbi:HYD1 signature containing ADP-ribosyltransferase family protein [Streptomyces montanus]|uniref:HYD1 signature containing ADP-ribosyltransferase family protein n=1 Tax=Streptomyces montanus TaxID=2580423 RepID=UPI001BB1725B|nr:HYD1 signature containing ADP-ribosyltransferase family protein [Streptomyces montanus]